MKSKTSCSKKCHIINKTILAKNITLFWPIWVIYLLYWLLVIPANLAMYFSFDQNNITNANDANLDQLIISDDLYMKLECALEPSMFVAVSFIMAAITGMALYNYLFTSKSANWFHSLPVTRGELFTTNVFSGLIFMWVPQFITFIVSVLVCVSNGVGDVKPFAEWLLLSLGVSFLFWSMVTFCAMFAGQLFAVPVYYCVINFLYMFIKLVLGVVLSFMGYGLNFAYAISRLPRGWLSPMYYLLGHLYITRSTTARDNVNYVTGISVEGGKIVTFYCIFALVLFAISAFLYKKRDIESAGDLITFKFVKPIFRWGVGACGGFGIGILLAELFRDMNLIHSKHVLIVLALVFGIVSFFIAEMFVQKKFKVFCKKAWKECGCFCLFIIVSYFAIYGYGSYLQSYIPDMDDVESASIYMDYEITYTGDKVNELIDLQKEILAKRNVFETYSDYDGMGVNFTYIMKNGRKVVRQYNVPAVDEGCGILKTIYDLECNPDNYRQHSMGADIVGVNGGRLALYDENLNYIADAVFTPEEAQIVFEGILKDIDAGNLQKYNLGYNYVLGENDSKQYSSDLSLEFKLSRDSQEESEEYISRSLFGLMENETVEIPTVYSYSEGDDNIRELYFYFGPECTNTINALIEVNAIDSADQLYCYPDEW